MDTNQCNRLMERGILEATTLDRHCMEESPIQDASVLCCGDTTMLTNRVSFPHGLPILQFQSGFMFTSSQLIKYFYRSKLYQS